MAKNRYLFKKDDQKICLYFWQTFLHSGRTMFKLSTHGCKSHDLILTIEKLPPKDLELTENVFEKRSEKVLKKANIDDVFLYRSSKSLYLSM